MCYSNAHSKKKGGNNMSKKKDKKLQDYEKNLKRYSKAHLAVELNDIKRKRILDNMKRIALYVVLVGGNYYLEDALQKFMQDVGIEMSIKNRLLAGLTIAIPSLALLLICGISDIKAQNTLTKKENIVCKYLDADEEVEKEKETEESKILK